MASDTAVEQKNKVTDKFKEPSRYKVVVCNDDVTPVDFVVSLLVAVFRHDEKAALDLTLSIHNKGSAVAGTFSYEVAEQKALDGTNLARTNGYPLIIKVEPE